jgi:carboxymethylenebutenolidase
MCFELNSEPPIARIAGAAVDSEDLTLTASDGTDFAAFVARGGEPGGAAVVVLPDVRGLFSFYEELALRIAEAGYDSVAIDYFGRTAGVSKRNDPDFEFREHVAQTTGDGVAADTRAAVEYLRQGEGNADRKIFTVGFCFGGSNSFHQASEGHGLAGVIGFYGHPTRARGEAMPAPIDRIGDVECPILGLMGGADEGIPKEEVDRYEAALAEAGKSGEFIFYEGAPHSFFDRSYEEHAEASADAWERVLAFVAANS